MKRFFQTFYGKLSAIFLVLLLIMAGIQTLITLRMSSQYFTEVDQRLNLTLASDMAAEITPFLDEQIEYDNIENAIHYMMVMNPKVEIYLLDETGNILSYYVEPGKTVQVEQIDLNPIRQFINRAEPVPILGQDPRQPNRQKPFSAATLPLGENRTGYLYVIIGGEQYDTAAQVIRNSYITQTTVRGLLITVGFAGMIGLILFAVLTRRLRNMAGVVKEFEQGAYEKRIDVSSNDEIGQLGESFNQMADTIVSNMDELKRTDKLRRDLIANVSHDLRSPLASIQGYLETILMKESTISPEKRRQFLELILRDTEMLNQMVHELFELSKLDANETEPQPESFLIAELVQDVVMKYKDPAEKSGLELTSDIPQNLPSVQADIAMIERALSNLLDNAIRYTPEGGEVHVELRQSDNHIDVTVADNGIGIPEEDLPHIFDRFFRSEKSRTMKNGSTGLGLAITKKLLELHDSQIQVESQQSEGTSFTFSLSIDS